MFSSRAESEDSNQSELPEEDEEASFVEED